MRARALLLLPTFWSAVNRPAGTTELARGARAGATARCNNNNSCCENRACGERGALGTTHPCYAHAHGRPGSTRQSRAGRTAPGWYRRWLPRRCPGAGTGRRCYCSQFAGRHELQQGPARRRGLRGTRGQRRVTSYEAARSPRVVSVTKSGRRGHLPRAGCCSTDDKLPSCSISPAYTVCEACVAHRQRRPRHRSRTGSRSRRKSCHWDRTRAAIVARRREFASTSMCIRSFVRQVTAEPTLIVASAAAHTWAVHSIGISWPISISRGGSR